MLIVFKMYESCTFFVDVVMILELLYIIGLDQSPTHPAYFMFGLDLQGSVAHAASDLRPLFE